MYKAFIPFLLLFVSYNSYTQSKASASASATIVASSVGITAFTDTGSASLHVNNNSIPGPNSPKGMQCPVAKINNSTNGPASFNLVGANEAFDITIPPGYTIALSASGKENISPRSFTITPVDITASIAASRAAANETPLKNREANVASTPLQVVVNFN